MVAMAEPWRHPETGTYYLRRQIPKTLRDEFGGKQLTERVTRRLLANRHADPDYDRKPSRAERRLMRSSLRLALNQMELQSLLPGVMESQRGDITNCERHVMSRFWTALNFWSA